jgi:ubiquinone/menaquinone biosynthesis C-methylase UbiE
MADRPLPPPELQLRTVGRAGETAFDEPRVFASDCLERFTHSRLWQRPDKTLLDFGTGWGRIARCFVPPFAAEHVVGADPNGDFLAYFRTAFPESRAILSNKEPPLPLPARSLDFVVGYSVFSHLDEALCRAWMNEFGRLLRSDGMVALTTRPRRFFDYAAALTGPDPYHQHLARTFADCAAAKAAYDRGEFVHFGYDYGESLIPERYARNAYAAFFRFAGFLDEGRDQPIMFFVRF